MKKQAPTDPSNTRCLHCNGAGGEQIVEGGYSARYPCYHCQETGSCTTRCHLCNPQHDITECRQCLETPVARLSFERDYPAAVAV